jgi:hypothetical protein
VPDSQCGRSAGVKLGGGNNGLDGRIKDYRFPSQLPTRSPALYRDWIRACKGREPACSNFDYPAPFMEWILPGCIALRVEGKLNWDAARMKFINSSEANMYLRMQYRKGWKV